jgi:mutator protein MutT
VTVRVVAAALVDEAGRVLLAERPPGGHLAGRWEFPGGKREPQETAGRALVRELAEELGVDVREASLAVALVHAYPERTVELSLWIVRAHRGEVRSLDSQRLAWVERSQLAAWDLLEADRPFVELLERMELRMKPALTGERFEVTNPRTGEVDYVFSAPAVAELEATAARLRDAGPAWREVGLESRIAVLRRWRDALRAAKPAIAGALATDTGRHLISAAEVDTLAATIDRWCALAPTLAREEDGRSAALPSIRYRSQFVPYPLVGVISPWNFPLTLATIDAVPALLAGCAVLVKPSEITPRWTEPVRATIESVPELARVFAIHAGGREAGEALVRVSDVVCFTGSVRTGRLVAENAARHFVPVFLELGGKDPVIVTASADLDRAADIVLRASCTATGQACQSLERVYVDRRVHDTFVAKLVERANAVEINWPDPARGALGPFIWARQAEIVGEQIADAVARGARVLTGGTIEDHGGRWLRPTVLVKLDHTMRVMTEETFGPVMPVMPFDTVDEAIALANEGVYGLSAAVIAGSLDEAEAIGRRIDAGAISLQDGALTSMVYEAEKHSFKQSGLGGSRMGPSGYTRFFRRKALLRQTGTPFTLDRLDERHAT